MGKMLILYLGFYFGGDLEGYEGFSFCYNSNNRSQIGLLLQPKKYINKSKF